MKKALIIIVILLILISLGWELWKQKVARTIPQIEKEVTPEQEIPLVPQPILPPPPPLPEGQESPPPDLYIPPLREEPPVEINTDLTPAIKIRAIEDAQGLDR